MSFSKRTSGPTIAARIADAGRSVEARKYSRFEALGALTIARV